ncbi:hypothetical protein K505DRAFT_244470 [Melanomma pulvis-pyrius CBS 109.77]|uniref:Rhodopsin domain-containing protein n=1 Tax=Melanomma pulvis-pyrius CBS 109.77 TaxID=1314802 RepID=A0A6A6XAY4_9PLEO|nr:hypothetical protein K505DRAFT_244470 [Melanomma pulvis-pyrius CBS 109.77]
MGLSLLSRNLDVPTRQWRIDHAGKIDKATSRALIWIFASLGVTASIVRLIFRIRSQQRFFYDDVLIIFATAFLIAETGCIYHYMDRMYILEAVKASPPIIPTASELIALTYSTMWLNIYNSLGWTAVFLIKASFLAIFWPLTKNMSRGITYYFWFGTILTLLSWMAIICEPFIQCPYFGVQSFKCAFISKKSQYMGLSLMVFLLDIATDVIIISFPLFLLRIARQMKLQHKIRVATFLCLSVAMVIISLVRISGGLYTDFQGKQEFSFVWSSVLLHIEAGVGVMMGSISAFRSVFTGHRSSSEEEQQRPSFLSRLMKKLRLPYATKKLGTSGNSEPSNQQLDQNSPQTRVTMFSLRRFIRRHNREPGHTTLESIDDPQDHYHNFVRQGYNGAHATGIRNDLGERESIPRPSENTDVST